MIKKQSYQDDKIIEAKCDCCDEKISIKYGYIDDHLELSGYKNGKLIEAIVCIKCMESKLKFINIQFKDNTIGYC